MAEAETAEAAALAAVRTASNEADPGQAANKEPTDGSPWNFNFDMGSFDTVPQGDLDPAEFQEIIRIKEGLSKLAADLDANKSGVSSLLAKAKEMREKADRAAKKRRMAAAASATAAAPEAETASPTAPPPSQASGSSQGTSGGTFKDPTDAKDAATQLIAEQISADKMAKLRADQALIPPSPPATMG